MYKITIAQRKELLSYMWTRPYGEVAQLVAMLASLKLDNTNEKKDDKDKKNNLS
jgi:hypothetical protein|tara:strand:+ start:57 stop:218 length:162 start_codon:yes stop_codon:yes gene_type:complete